MELKSGVATIILIVALLLMGFSIGHKIGYDSGWNHGADVVLDTMHHIIDRQIKADTSTVTELTIASESGSGKDTNTYYLSHKTLKPQ